DDLEQRGRGVPVGGGHDDLVDAVDVFDAVLDPLDVIERIVAGHDLAGHDQRAVEAGSEVLVDEIVGRPCRGALPWSRAVGRDSWSWVAGMAKSASPPTMTMIVSSGIFVTIFSQPEKNVSMIVFG